MGAQFEKDWDTKLESSGGLGRHRPIPSTFSFRSDGRGAAATTQRGAVRCGAVQWRPGQGSLFYPPVCTSSIGACPADPAATKDVVGAGSQLYPCSSLPRAVVDRFLAVLRFFAGLVHTLKAPRAPSPSVGRIISAIQDRIVPPRGRR